MPTDRKFQSDVEYFKVMCQYDSRIPLCPDLFKSVVTKRLLNRCMDVERDSFDPYMMERTLRTLLFDKFFKNFLANITAKVFFISSGDHSAFVARVLNEIHEFHGHFNLIFDNISGMQNEGSTLYLANITRPAVNLNPWRLHTGGLIIIEHFLYHATKERLIFENSRFVDLNMWPPRESSLIYHAVVANSPNLLLLLLRYGAQVKVHGEERLNGFNHSLQYLLQMLWRLLQYSSRTHCIAIQDMIQCVNIFLRVLPQIKLREIEFTISFLNNNMGFSTNGTDFVKDLVDGCELPKLQIRLSDLSELQHLCRCLIRKCLHMNWMLPFGIKKLPIPERLRRYIDLFED